MKIEYAVQMKAAISDDWIFCSLDNSTSVTTPDIEAAKRMVEVYKIVVPNRKFRIAVRQATDWCECTDAKIGEHK